MPHCWVLEKWKSHNASTEEHKNQLNDKNGSVRLCELPSKIGNRVSDGPRLLHLCILVPPSPQGSFPYAQHWLVAEVGCAKPLIRLVATRSVHMAGGTDTHHRVMPTCHAVGWVSLLVHVADSKWSVKSQSVAMTFCLNKSVCNPPFLLTKGHFPEGLKLLC